MLTVGSLFLFKGNTTKYTYMKEFSIETRKRMSESAKKRCTLEWKNRLSDKLSTKLPFEEVKKMYEQNMTQQEIAIHFGTTQRVVWGFMKRNGIKSRIAAKRNQFGSNNDFWKGENAGYKAFHLRVQNTRGKPNVCHQCGTTKSKRFEWANLTGDYGNIWDYKRMCKSCHSKFDGVGRNFGGGVNARK